MAKAKKGNCNHGSFEAGKQQKLTHAHLLVKELSFKTPFDPVSSTVLQLVASMLSAKANFERRAVVQSQG
jgi:hypothetical protein